MKELYIVLTLIGLVTLIILGILAVTAALMSGWIVCG